MNRPPHRLGIHLYVQHLLGAGHLVRMRVLAAALADAGHRVTLISGGVPTDSRKSPEDGQYKFFQLPAVKVAPGDFSALLGQDGRPVSEDFKARRREQLLQRVRADSPDVLVVETFPFGRRALRFELLPLMQMVDGMAPRPLRLCSLRDILQLRTAARYRQTVAEVNAWFDHVLVHADPAVATLAETFPLAGELGDRVFHSGYIYAPGDCRGGTTKTHERGEVIVSAGGGAVGLGLLETAIAARRYSALRDRPWRLLVGGNVGVAGFDALRGRAGDGVTVEWNRPDFAALLSRCAVSVSQAGYNTVLDTVAANCRAVLVPFSRHGETEQTHRAKKISELGRAVLLAEKNLNPKGLAAAVDRAAHLDLSKCQPVKMDGAQQTARFIEDRFAQRQCAQRP